MPCLRLPRRSPNPSAAASASALRDRAVIVGVDPGKWFSIGPSPISSTDRLPSPLSSCRSSIAGRAVGQAFGEPGQLARRQAPRLLRVPSPLVSAAANIGGPVRVKLGLGQLAILSVSMPANISASIAPRLRRIALAHLGHCGRGKARDKDGTGKGQRGNGGFLLVRSCFLLLMRGRIVRPICTVTRGAAGFPSRIFATLGHSLNAAPVACPAQALCSPVSATRPRSTGRTESPADDPAACLDHRH